MIDIDNAVVNNESDQDLISAILDGNFEAFERLVERYKLPLWNYVYGLTGNREDANDVVQQTLIQLYRSLPTLKDRLQFRPWLFRIARNKYLDYRRTSLPIPFADFKVGRSGLPELDAETSPLQFLPDTGPALEELVERRETRQLLEQAIASLPERQRQVVILRYTTDLSFAEIGDSLKTKESTVKTLFQRSKAQLRLYLRQRTGQTS